MVYDEILCCKQANTEILKFANWSHLIYVSHTNLYVLGAKLFTRGALFLYPVWKIIWSTVRKTGNLCTLPIAIIRPFPISVPVFFAQKSIHTNLAQVKRDVFFRNWYIVSMAYATFQDGNKYWQLAKKTIKNYLFLENEK